MDIGPNHVDPIELESSVDFAPMEDVRPRVDPPRPVSLLAVADCTLPAIAGLEPGMDDFYLDILQFARDDADGWCTARKTFA